MQPKIVLATSKDGSIEYIQISKDLLQESLEVLRKSFYKHENICVALGLPDHPECFPEMDNVVIKAAKCGISVAAVDKASGKVAGVAINKIQGPGQYDFYLRHIESSKSSVFRNVMQCMLDIDKIFDIYEYCNVRSAMEIMFVGIMPEFRKRGIAKTLFQVSIEVARRMKEGRDSWISIDDRVLETPRSPEIVTAVCTSFVTQKIVKELNFEIAARIDFDKFKYDGISLGTKVPSTTQILTYDYLRL